MCHQTLYKGSHKDDVIGLLNLDSLIICKRDMFYAQLHSTHILTQEIS